MTQSAWETVTRFGESSLILPAAALVAAFLFVTGYRRVALAWVAMLLLAVAVTTLGKVGLDLCPAGGRLGRLRSPSGHTSLSVVFYTGLAVIVGQGRRSLAGIAPVLIALAFCATIALSRTHLGVHSSPEVVTGFLIGCLCCWGFFLAVATTPMPGAGTMIALLVVMVAGAGILFFTQDHFDGETVVDTVALWLRGRGLGCG